MNYNKGYTNYLQRFANQYDSEEANFQNSAGALGQMFKYNNLKGTGLLGLGSFGKEGTAGTPPMFKTLGDAEDFRNKNKGTEKGNMAQGLINAAYKGVAPDDYTKKASNFLAQNTGVPGTPGTEGDGLLGQLQKLDQATGGYGAKGMKAVGKFAMEKLGGETLKNSAFGGFLGGAAAAAGPLMAVVGTAQAGKELIDSTVDQYESLESGIATGEVMQDDLSSRASEAKVNLFSSNKELNQMLADRKGKLTSTVGAQAEQVLTAKNTVASNTGLETSSNPYKKTEEGLIDSYVDSAGALGKQMEKIKTDNINQYRTQKDNLIAEGQALQSNIDSMQSSKDDMEGMYQVADKLQFWG